jgi:hypothetical protein
MQKKVMGIIEVTRNIKLLARNIDEVRTEVALNAAHDRQHIVAAHVAARQSRNFIIPTLRD